MKRRNLAKRSTKRTIGNSDEMELEKPRTNRVIEIFADTETFLDTGGMEPWNYVGTKHYNERLSEAVVVPFILVWHYPRFKERSMKDELYKTGWIERVTLNDENKFEAFFADLNYIYQELKATPKLYFHNSSYDIPVLTPYFEMLDPDIVIYFYTASDDKQFLRGCMQSPKYDFYCEFGDTMSYKCTSIAKAGEIMGKPKIEGMPYGMCDIVVNDNTITYTSLDTGLTEDFPLDKYIEYAVNDVVITREMHLRNQKIINEVNHIMIKDYDDKKLQENVLKRCRTQASHSKVIADYYLKTRGWEGENGQCIDTWFRFNIDDPEVYKATIEANCGGFTSYNKDLSKFECDEDWLIKCFDMNSMYPTMMMRGISYGEILDTPPDGPYVKWYVIKLKSCQWKGVMASSNTQAFGVKKTAEYPFYVESDYFEWVLERADVEYELVDTKYQEKTRILKQLIETYYTERTIRKKAMKEHAKHTKEYKDLNDQQDSLKLLMNSLYGKMCEKGHHKGCVYHRGVYNEFVQKRRDKNNNEYYSYPCILSGAHITYQGRLELLKKIEAVMKRGWIYLYSDTDSVIFAYPKSDDPTIVFGNDTGELGQWKDEGTFDLYLNVLKKKKYALINTRQKDFSPEQKDSYKVAFSGVSKSFIEKRLNSDFKGAIEDLKFMLNPENNVKLIGMKKTRIKSNYYDQKIIYNTDFEINGGFNRQGKKVPVNGEIIETKDGFLLTRF